MFTWNIEYRPIKPKGFFSLHLSCFEKVFSQRRTFELLSLTLLTTCLRKFSSRRLIFAQSFRLSLCNGWVREEKRVEEQERESKRGREEGDCIPSPKSWCERKWFYLKRIATINTATVLSMEILSQYPLFSLPQQKHPSRSAKLNFYRQRCK